MWNFRSRVAASLCCSHHWRLHSGSVGAVGVGDHGDASLVALDVKLFTVGNHLSRKPEVARSGFHLGGVRAS